MKKLFAFFLLLLGVGMVTCGIYYKDVLNYLGISTQTQEEREFPESILCARKKKNLEAELTVNEKSQMFFTEKGLLTTIEDKVEIAPIDKSEESMQKLNRYYTSMEKVIYSFKDYNGLEEKHNREKELISYTVRINLKDFKKKKTKEEKAPTEEAPQETQDAITTDEDGNATVDFISLTKDAELKFTYKQTYKKVKEEREKEGFDCTIN